MNKTSLNGVRTVLMPLAFLCITPVCQAQESMEPQVPVHAKKPPARQVGDVTSSLLAIQVSGSAAGPALPLLGATSSLSWERYKESFTYKIPESFDRAVSKSNTSGQ
jgi:hypothetical protein